jgi:hypothetical protein
MLRKPLGVPTKKIDGTGKRIVTGFWHQFQRNYPVAGLSNL